MLGLSRKQVLNELRLAVIAWGCVYGILFSMLLVYRYNTHSYYVSQKLKAEQAMNNVIQTTIVTKQVPKVNPLQPYEAKLNEMTQELTAAHQSVQAKLNLLNEYTEKLEAIKASPLLKDDILRPSIKEPDMPPLESWQQLLQLQSLQDVNDEQLDGLFDNALAEMNEALQSPEKMDWGLLQEWLEGERNDSELVCPTAKRRRSRQQYPNAAYESDLNERMKELDDYFGKRTPAAGVRALGTISRNVLQQDVSEGASAMLREILQFVEELEQRMGAVQQTSSDEGAATPASCDTDLELVTALVDAGLKAMAVHGDVREAVRRTTLEYDPSIKEDDLILDADLPSSPETEPESTTINLRSAIETPVLIEAIQWIDELVDLVGGYNDKLDQYLDSLTEGEDESVGEVVVERLLNKAGMVDVDVKELGDKVKLSPTMQRKIMEKFN